MRSDLSAGGLIALLCAVSGMAIAGSSCPPVPPGVHTSGATDAPAYTVVAQSQAASTDADAIALAEAEARMQARRELISRLDPKASSMRLHGLVDVSVCHHGATVYAVMQMSPANVRRAVALRSHIDRSIKDQPTPGW